MITPLHTQYFTLEDLVAHLDVGFDQLHLLIDENVYKIYFSQDRSVKDCASLYILPSGETYKNLNTCIAIWQRLAAARAERNHFLINIGGGVVTDMGGFAASVFKRGIRFVHVPTTLLAMADAAVGGKTGIDLYNIKNLIGTFSEPQLIWLDPDFLKTLPPDQLLSGFAEVLKYGLILDKELFEALKHVDPLNHPASDWGSIISRCIELKQKIVQNDPYEQGVRKILNFGHTVGHAIEACFLDSSKPVLHGMAIATGMMVEAALSKQLCGLPEEDYEAVLQVLDQNYTHDYLRHLTVRRLMPYIRQDKKRQHGRIVFSGLKAVGQATERVECPEEMMEEALGQHLSRV